MDVAYFEPGDILTVHFHGSPQPAVSIPAEDDLSGLYWRVDIHSQEVIGFEIHGYLESFLPRHPEAEAFAKLASIPRKLVEQSLRHVDQETKSRLEFFAISEEVRSYTGSV